jgi:hypothetical protein
VLAEFRDCGVLPGKRASFTWQGKIVNVSVEGFERQLELPIDLAINIFVSP